MKPGGSSDGVPTVAGSSAYSRASGGACGGLPPLLSLEPRIIGAFLFSGEDIVYLV